MSFITLGPFSFLLFMVTLLYFFFSWKHRKTYFGPMDITGPLSLPVLGIAYKLATLNSNDFVDTVSMILRRYNGFLKIWFGFKLYFLISKPEHCHKVLSNPKALNKDSLYKMVENLTGPGLLSAPVATWRRHRKALMPAFNQKVLDSFVERFAEQSNIFNDVIDNYIGNADIDLFKLASRCTLDTICENAIGINLNQQTKNSNFSVNLERLTEIIEYRLYHIWCHSDFIFNYTSLAREFKWRQKEFHQFISEIVKAKMDKRDQKIIKQNDPSYVHQDESAKKIAFLDLLMENSNFSFEEILSEVNVFIIGGTDTSAATFCSILMMMGMFPQIQQEVLDEILETIGPDQEILSSDLPRLKYMERVIKESSRLFPVVAYFSRYLDDDIDIGDTVLPLGSNVFFSAVYINRNPEYWPDPLKFDPDRFLPENVQKRHPCAFMSFSSGPRNCIGARYGILNLKVMVATVLRKYKVHCDYKRIEDIRLKTHVFLAHRDGCKVRFERRY